MTVSDADTGEILRAGKLPSLKRAKDDLNPGQNALATVWGFNGRRRVSITIEAHMPEVLRNAEAMEYEFNYRWHEHGRRYRLRLPQWIAKFRWSS